MDCDTLRRSLRAYEDGVFSAVDAAAAAAHLRVCARCRARLESLRQARGAFQVLPREAAPPDFSARLLRRLDLPRRAWAGPFLPRAWAPALAAAAVVAFLVFARRSPPRGAALSSNRDARPGWDSGRVGYDPLEASLCGTARDCS